MAKRATIKLAALNIVTHPHSPEKYADLFQASFDAQTSPVPLWGDQFGLVLSCFPINKDNLSLGLEGEIVRYMQISAEEPWFNITKAEEATKAEKQQISIPAHLRPKMKRLRYFFDPVSHRLVFITSFKDASMSPSLAQLLFSSFLNNSNLAAKFPSATVTVEQSRRALQDVFEIHRLDKLTISFNKPNADEGNLSEEALLREMDAQNIGALETRFWADPKSSIKLSPHNKLLAKVAVSNGFVEGIGKTDEGMPVRINTEDKPMIKPLKEEIGKINLVEWMRVKAADMVAFLTKTDEPNE